MSINDDNDMALTESFGDSTALVPVDPLDEELVKFFKELKNATPRPNLAVRVLGVKGCALAAALATAAASFSAYFVISNGHFRPLKAGYYTLRSNKVLQTMPYDEAPKADRLNAGDCIASDGDASAFGYDDYKGHKGFLKKHWLHLPPQAGWQKKDLYVSEDDVEFISEDRPDRCTHCRYVTESKQVTKQRQVVTSRQVRPNIIAAPDVDETFGTETYQVTVSETHREEYETCDID